MKKLVAILILFIFSAFAPTPSFKLCLLKYSGGGDWYANLETSLPNLARYCNQNLGMNIDTEQGIAEVGSPELFNYPFVHMTGHGNVVFSLKEAENLRNYLIGGGFLHIDDNYGMDKFIRPQLKKVFPEYNLVELPFNHPIYHQTFDFNNGLPKIHEHDNKTPGGYGIIHDGRLVLFYSVESDLGDGWEDVAVHKDSEKARSNALKMGANLIEYVMGQ